MKTLKQNFLVFRGTREEVDAAPGIDRCWYLAWDTGELFVGNSVGTKTKYGGNAKTMSKADIIDFVNEQFKPILQINNDTINEIKKTTSDFIDKTDKIVEEVKNTVDSLNNEIVEFAKQKVEEAIQEGGFENFLTKDEIVDLLSNYATKEYIENNYYNKDNSDGKYIIAAMGKDIFDNKSKNGTYLALSSYQSGEYNIESGVIYKATNGVLVKVMSSGTGGVSEFKINKFTINGQTSILNSVEQISEDNEDNGDINLNIVLPTDYTALTNVENGDLVKELKILLDNKVAVSNVSKLDGDQIVKVPASFLNTNNFLGRHIFKLVGTKSNNTTVEKTVTMDFIRPVYWGIGTDTTPDFSDLTKKVTRNPSGEYSFTTTAEKPYFWIAVPINAGDAMSITKISSGGFEVPSTSVEIHKNNYLFRRNDSAFIGSAKFDITGTGL